MIYEVSRGLQRQDLIVSDIDYEPDFAYREQMLVHNTIPGILKLSVAEEDGKRKYLYDIGNMDSLRNRYDKGSVNCNELRNLFREILKCADTCREYLLSEEDMLLEPEAMFVDGDVIRLAYVPGLNRALHEQLAALCEFFMNRVDYRDEQAVVLIYAFYMSVKEESCTMEKLYELLNRKTEGQVKENEITSQTAAEGSSITEPGSSENQKTEIKQKETVVLSPPHTPKLEKMTYRPEAKAGNRKSRLQAGRTVLVSAVGLAVFVAVLFALGKGICRKSLVIAGLSGIAAVCAASRLIPKKQAHIDTASTDEEKTELLFGVSSQRTLCTLVSDERDPITVNHLPFYIGKDPIHMDYILDEPGVSRVHAKLDSHNEIYELTDLDSTNGTYINGKRLNPQSPAILRRGDEICFGKVRYFFN